MTTPQRGPAAGSGQDAVRALALAEEVTRAARGPAKVPDLSKLPAEPKAPDRESVNDWSLQSMKDYLDALKACDAYYHASHAAELQKSGGSYQDIMQALAAAEMAAPEKDRSFHAGRLDQYAAAHGLKGWYRHQTSRGEHLVQVNKIRTPAEGDKGRYYASDPFAKGTARVVDRDTGKFVTPAMDPKAARDWISNAESARLETAGQHAGTAVMAAQDAPGAALDQDRNEGEDIRTTIAITCLYSNDVTDQSGWRKFSGGSLRHAIDTLRAHYGVESTNPVVLLDDDGEIEREVKVFDIQPADLNAVYLEPAGNAPVPVAPKASEAAARVAEIKAPKASGPDWQADLLDGPSNDVPDHVVVDAHSARPAAPQAPGTSGPNLELPGRVAAPGGSADFPDRYVVARINKTYRTLGEKPGPEHVGKSFVPYDNRHLSKEAAEEGAKVSNDRYRPHLHGKTFIAVRAEPIAGTNRFRNLEHPSLLGNAKGSAGPTRARRRARPASDRTRRAL